MTLPIPMVRPAPEPPTPSGNEPASTSSGQRRQFGAALASAMHPSADGPGDTARRRRIGGARTNDDLQAADSMTRGEPRAPHGMAAEREQVGHGAPSTTCEPIEQALGGATASAVPGIDDASMPPRPLMDTLTALLEGRDERTPMGMAMGSTMRPVGAATDEADADEDAGSLADRFVASSLEAAVAPLAPLALVVTPPATAAIAPNATASTSSAANGAGDADLPAAASTPLAPTWRESRPEAEARLAGLAAAVSRNPRAVHRGVEALVPEMRQRLDRVIERMEQEFGYTVDVVETVRTQERQDALYAQGRTTPGQVVTWTRNSKHLDGVAADVVIDGGYTDTAGFERLARVAREEGLRTLWPRDPGHIELAPNANAATDAIAARVPRGAGRDGSTPPLAFPSRATAATTAEPPAIPRAARAAIDPALHSDATAAVAPLGAETIPGRATDAQLLPLPFRGPSRAGAGDPGEASPTQHGESVGPAPAGLSRGLGVATAAEAGKSATAAWTSLAQQATHPSGVAPIATVAQVASVAGVAPVAHVAHVAQVAQVARVAEVANVGEMPGDARGAAEAPTPSTIAGASAIARDASARGSAASDRRSSGERGERGSRGRSDDSDSLAGAVASRDERAGTRLPLVRELAARELASLDDTDRRGASPVAGLAHSDASERIARVLRIQEAGHDRPVSSVLLRLDHPEGGEDRIRIDLRGKSIGATLDVADPRAAEQLRQHVGELQDALQRQGLEGESMVVRTAQRTTDATTLTASAIAAERDVLRAASASASDGGGSTAKDSRNQTRAPFDRDVDREGTDQQRSRQRRDGKGDTR